MCAEKNLASQELSSDFLQVLRDAQLNQASSPQLINQLPALLSQRARELERADLDEQLVTNSNFQGYLSRWIGEHQIHVPFPLVPYLPSVEVLLPAIKIAIAIAVGTDGCICISGSTVFAGSGLHVSDLDFCEYLFNATSLAEAVMEQIQRPELPLASVVKCGQDFTSPWSGLHGALASLVGRGPPTENEARPIKLDFLAEAEALGPIPATNVILWLDQTASEAGNARRSFAYQEAVIDRGHGVARTLALADRLGAYLKFLCEQIEELKATDTLKALKRGLCVLSFLNLEEWTETVCTALKNPVIGKISRLKRFQKLERLFLMLSDDRKNICEPAMQIARQNISIDNLQPKDVQTVQDIMSAIVNGLSTEIAERTAELGASHE